MQKAKPISVFVIAKNEAEKIEACLKQARKIADELILVDSGSTDETVSIAQKYCDKVEHHDWEGYSKQKEYALSLCSNYWVLSLDADEVITDDLIDEINQIDNKRIENINIYAYRIARKLFIGDQFIEYGGYYPDYQTRFFVKNFARFSDSSVHESVEIKERNGNFITANNTVSEHIQNLENPLLHYSYKDINELELAFDKFAKLANQSIDNNKKSPIKAFCKAIYTFCYKYFIRLGLVEGGIGFKLALINAKYTFNKWKS